MPVQPKTNGEAAILAYLIQAKEHMGRDVAE
jgi:hypothetical protein